MRVIIILFSFCLALLHSYQAQSIPLWQRTYLALEAGGLMWLDGMDAHNLEVGMGYQHCDWVGLGLDLGTYSDFANYNVNLRGYSVHYQAQPGPWVLRLSVGNLYDWDRESSSSYGDSLAEAFFNPFFKAKVAWRPWPFLQVGMMALVTSRVEIHTYYMGWPSRDHRSFYPRIFTLQPFVGFTFPGRRYRKNS